MEDIIKELEDDENKYFNVGEAGMGGNKTQENDNYFDEENALKRFELLKAERDLKKSLYKRVVELKISCFIYILSGYI